MINLAGKWALVTGASRGIGALAAVELAKQGIHLVLQARTVAHCENTYRQVKALGVEAYLVEAELSETTAVQAMLDEIDRRETQIDIVLNNAGLQVGYRTDYWKTPVSDYTKSFQVNTIAPMMICYHFLPQMMARGFGRIVNTTSGIQFEPEQAGYSASKAALDKVTMDLGTKLIGTDVTINLADPGWCQTDMGGPNAPNMPSDAIPGVIMAVFLSDKRSGRIFRANDYKGLTLAEAVAKAEAEG